MTIKELMRQSTSCGIMYSNTLFGTLWGPSQECDQPGYTLGHNNIKMKLSVVERINAEALGKITPMRT